MKNYKQKIASVIFVVVAVLAVLKAEYKISNSVPVVGTVVLKDWDDFFDEIPVEIVYFEDLRGRGVEVEVMTCCSRTYVGQKLNLYFNKSNPEKVIVDNFFSIYLTPSLIPVIFITMGGAGLLASRRKIKGWPVTKGKVVGYVTDEDDDNLTRAHIIQYEINGEKYTNQSPLAWLLPKKHKEGKVLDIHYNPEDYNEITPDTVYNMYIDLFLILIPGIIILILF
jgi:hypothetical protein